MIARRSLLAGAACFAPCPALARAPARPSDPLPRVREPGPPVAAASNRPEAYRLDAKARLGDARLVTLYAATTWSEGPVWWPAERTLVWSDVVGRRVLGWREDGAVDVVIDATDFINGNGLDRDGHLLHCEHGRRCVSRSEANGTLTILATHADGTRLNAPNDLVVTPDGAIWFTEPTFGIDNPKQGVPAKSESGRTSVCRLAPGAPEARRMADLTQPNGLGFSPDGGTLYVSQTPAGDTEAQGLFAFAWDGTRLSDRRAFARVRTGVPDGFAIDRNGWIWCSSGQGIEVFDSQGARIAFVPTPGLASNCAFDADERRLFVTGGDCLWRLDLPA